MTMISVQKCMHAVAILNHLNQIQPQFFEWYTKQSIKYLRTDTRAAWARLKREPPKHSLNSSFAKRLVLSRAFNANYMHRTGNSIKIFPIVSEFTFMRLKLVQMKCSISIELSFANMQSIQNGHYKSIELLSVNPRGSNSCKQHIQYFSK